MFACLRVFHVLFLCVCMCVGNNTVGTICPCAVHVSFRLYTSHAVGSRCVRFVCLHLSICVEFVICHRFCKFVFQFYNSQFAPDRECYVQANGAMPPIATTMRQEVGRSLQLLRPCDKKWGDASTCYDHATVNWAMPPTATAMRQEMGDASNQERCIQSSHSRGSAHSY